jgi:hypothetical protein
MVNTEMVKRKLAKGITTGIGVFGSTLVGNVMEEQLPIQGNQVGVGQMALGAGIAVGSERLGSVLGQRAGQPEGLVEIGVEHIGYGIHGAGFAEVADNLQTGARSDRVVSVNTRDMGSSEMQTSAAADRDAGQRDSELSLDV